MEKFKAALEYEDAWYLTADEPEDRPPPPVKPPKKLSEQDKRQKTILVVEADHKVRQAVLEALAEEGYGAVSVRNGVEAVQYLTYVPKLPDLILLDLHMPVMDGWELKKRLEKEVAWQPIPVILYTANTKEEPVKIALVFNKPISLARLMKVVTAHLEES